MLFQVTTEQIPPDVESSASCLKSHNYRPDVPVSVSQHSGSEHGLQAQVSPSYEEIGLLGSVTFPTLLDDDGCFPLPQKLSSVIPTCKKVIQSIYDLTKLHTDL